MTFLDAQSRNLGSLGDVRADVLLAFTGLGVLVLLAFHGFGQFRHRQVEVARPDLIVKRVGADHLICRKQPVQTSIADAGIQRPLVFSDLLNYPANEPSAAADSVRFPRTFPVRLVDRFSTSCRSIRASCPCCSFGAACRASARFQRWLANIRLPGQWLCSCSLRS